MGSRLRSRHLPLLALATGLVFTTPSYAQYGGDGFLFSEPAAVLGVQGGFSRPSANSDVFSFLTELLTLEQGDFAGFSVGGSVFFPVSERLSLGVSGAYSSRTSRSEYRDWTDQDDLPIEQRTNFIRIPILGSARVYLLPRGESVGNLAWIPAPYAPYIGLGGGALWHRLRIAGDMFDYDDPNLEIYHDELTDFGWSPALQGLAGVDIDLTPRLMVTGEVNYIWSNTEPGQRFDDFDDPLDLSGFTGTVGLFIRL